MLPKKDEHGFQTTTIKTHLRAHEDTLKDLHNILARRDAGRVSYLGREMGKCGEGRGQPSHHVDHVLASARIVILAHGIR